MEIILLKDMDNLGLAKSVVSVKAGYARNYLIPQGFAIIANRANLNSLKQEIQLQEERAQKILDEANELAAKFAESTLKQNQVLPVKFLDLFHLFRSQRPYRILSTWK